MIVMNSGSQLSEMTTISHISFTGLCLCQFSCQFALVMSCLLITLIKCIKGHKSTESRMQTQGCRICGSVAALLPGTVYFARHFLLNDENWWVAGGGWQVAGGRHCSHTEWGPNFFKMGTKWGPDFEWNGDLRQQKWGPNGDLKSVYLINWPKRANSLR